MANDFLDDLSAKELSAEETRQVLRRLAQDEFAVTDRATVADLAELTGVRTESIGRILAELRGETWAEWRESVDAKYLEAAATQDPTSLGSRLRDRERVPGRRVRWNVAIRRRWNENA